MKGKEMDAVRVGTPISNQLAEHFGEVIDFLPDATLIIDTDGKVIAWNKAMEELTGVPAAEMIGKGDHEYAIPFYGGRKPILIDLVFLPDEEVERRYHSIVRDGRTLVVDIEIPTFRGRGAYLWAKASPLCDREGRIVGAIESIREITDRKMAEQEMERTHRRLEEIIDFLPDATFVIDTQGKVIAWNKAMEEITGVDSSVMIGKGDHEYALPFYGERQPMLANLILLPDEVVERRYHSVKRLGDTLVVDIFLPSFRGRSVYFWAKASPLYDADGKVTGAIETIRDITDRRRAVQEIQQTRRRLSEIIDSLPDATVVIDTTGTVIAWNKAMEEFTGVAAIDMVGKGDYEYALPFYGERKPILADLIFLPDGEVEKRYHSIVRDGTALVVDIDIPTFRGRGAYLWAKASPLYDADGKVTGAIETIRDISERRRLEERIARSNAELQIAAEIQQGFLPEQIPRVRGFDIAARCVMAKEVGGDFFDVIPFEVIPLDGGKLGILIADVSGKGVPAALFMALSRIIVRTNAIWHHDPAKAMAAANDIIMNDSKAGMFVTLFYGVISEKDRTLTYANAGHNPPLLQRRDGSVEELAPTGMALGVAEHQPYEARTVAIGPDDVLLLYTDGVTEAVDPRTEMFGEERLIEIIRHNAALPPGALLDKILSSVQEFSQGAPQFDDITLMAIKGER
jgi:PAS domain S-box-containing protein